MSFATRGWALALCAAAIGCGGTRSVAIPLPDLTSTEPQVAASIEDAAAAVRARPETADVWGRLGNVLDAHRFLKEAASCYRKAAELAPDSFDWHYDLAVVLDLQGADAGEIERLLDRAARIRPDYAPLHYLRGSVSGRRGDSLAARRHFERALAVDPRLGAAHRALGQLLIALDDVPGAVEHLQRAVALDPEDGAAFASLARAWMLAGEPARAKEAEGRSRALPTGARMQDPVRSAVSALNASSIALAARGRAAMNAGRHEEALKLFLEADHWNPGNANFHYNVGVCYLNMHRPDSAEKEFRRAISLGGDAEVHWRLATLLLARGDTEQALVELRRAAESAPDHGVLLAQIATSLARAGRAEESLTLFARAVELGADGAGPLNNWGAALLELGRPADAVERFRRAMEAEPDQPDAYLNAGRALERLGRSDEAAELYREAQALDPGGPGGQRLEELRRGGSQPRDGT